MTGAQRTSRRGRLDYIWRCKELVTPDSQFTGPEIAAPTNQELETPLGYFRQFVTDEMLNNLVEQTNIYSAQKYGHSINTTKKELEQMIGINFYMGLIRMEGARQYWETDIHCDLVANVMSRNRFQLFVRTLHFVDNMRISEDEKKEDKLRRIRQWLTQMRENCLKLTPEEHCSIDEMMCQYRGQTSPIRQYIKGKPHP